MNNIEIKETEKEFYIIINGQKFNYGIVNYGIKRKVDNTQITITFSVNKLKTNIEKRLSKS